MKFSFLFLIIFIISKSSHSQNIERNNKHLILWDSTRKLSYTDFKIKKLIKFDALSYVDLKYFIKKEEDSITIEIIAFFDKRKSSRNEIDTLSKSLLNHEQLHFDITELYSRIIKKKMERSKNVERKFSKIYKKGRRRHSKAQDKYDKETKHGILEIKQKEWEYKINLKLLEFQNYSSPLTKKL